MTANNEFQPIDVTFTELNQAASDRIMDASAVHHPFAPQRNLKQFADIYGVNANTLRSRWVPKLETMLEGTSYPAIRSEGSITEFGWGLLTDYINRVVNGDESFESFKADYQVSQSAPAGALALTTVKPVELSEITPIELINWEVQDTSDQVLQATEQFNQTLDAISANGMGLLNGLINQYRAQGELLGQALVQAKYSTAFATVAEFEKNLGKAQGLNPNT